MDKDKSTIYIILFIMIIIIGLGARTNIIENIFGERLDNLNLREALGEENLESKTINMSLLELDENIRNKILSEELRTKVSNPDIIFKNKEDREMINLNVHVSMDLLEDKKSDVYIFPKGTNCEKYYDRDKKIYIDIDEIGPKKIRKSFLGYKKNRDKIKYSYNKKIKFDEEMITELKIYPLYEKVKEDYYIVGLVVFEISFNK